MNFYITALKKAKLEFTPEIQANELFKILCSQLKKFMTEILSNNA